MRSVLALLFMLFALPAFAQDTPAEEESFFTNFVENQLSTPNRQISISGIRGALSSNATIGLITIADHEGVWLRILNASIDWNRSALFRRSLEIERLSADSIEVLRQPLPEEGLPSPEAGGFQVPELPLTILLQSLEAPSIIFGGDVFGLESEIAVTGRLRLEGGSLDTALEVRRLDGPGGELTLAVTYANESEVLDIDLSLTEPEDGVVANLLGIEGRPPIALTLAGEGPLGETDLALTLDADGERVLTGATRLRRRAEGLAFDADVDGSIASLVPARFREFFGASTALQANGVFKEEGGLRIDGLALASAALTLEGSLETAADGFLERLALNATIDDPGPDRIILPVPGGETTVENARLTIGFGTGAEEEWTGAVEIADLTTGAFSAESVTLDLGGLAQNIENPSERRVTFEVDGLVSGIVAERADIADALGEQLRLEIGGEWEAGMPITLARALLAGNGLEVLLAGQIAEYAFSGDIAVEASSIAPFSELAGRDLSGSLELAAQGQLRPLTGAFDLVLDGEASGLQIGNEAADNLLDGTTAIDGRVARSEEGLTADDLRIANEQITLTADGTFATGAADFDFDFMLADLALVSERASGRLTATGRAVGSEGLVGLTLIAESSGGSLAGKRLADAVFSFEGTQSEDAIDGQVAGSAFLDGVRVELASGVAFSDGERRLTDIDFSAGGTRLTGGLTQTEAGLFEGQLTLESADLSTAAALLLLEASGRASADIALSIEGERQNARLEAAVADLEAEDVSVGAAEIEAAVEDLFGVPVVSGTVSASDATTAGIEIATLEATATTSGETTNFSAEATLDNGAVASAAGALFPVDGGYRLQLENAGLARGELAARLVEPASLLVAGDDISIDAFIFDVGGGRVAIDGTVAEALDLDVSIASVPLEIANAVRPDLGLGGTVDGTATIGGTREAPAVAFDVAGRDITAATLRQAGLRSIAVDAEGSTSGGRLSVDASVTSPEGLRATVQGSAPLGEGSLALDVEVGAFPLAALNAVVPDQGLAGMVSGSARVTGPVSDPSADFDLTGTDVSAAPLAEAGVGPLDVRAAGRYADETVRLTSATAGGPRGLTLSATGSVPLTGSGLAVNVAGQAPLSLADRFLADRGAQVLGAVSLNATITGSLQDPSFGGSFSTSGAEFVDPETNIRLNDIVLSGSIDGQTVRLSAASASLAAGGAVSASGTIALDAGLPADLRITLDQARYADGELVVATLSGELSLTGQLARDPLLSGAVAVDRAEIMVPENLGAGSVLVDVEHVAPPPGVVATLARARADDGTPTPSARPSVVRLDVLVSAPNQIFVRGRGLDAELGGEVRLTGPLTDIQPVGAFDLIRGRLSIIGQRITFDEGTVTLVGDLDPLLNFVARSEGADITVFITVTGRVSDLDISFSSQPQLPEDEVLARLIFNRGIGELSALQIAQLAAAAAELAGGGNTSLLGSLREATGLDDLDIVTDAEGNAAVRAGRYIQDNVYLGVEAGAGGATRATINLDITEDLKAKGSLGTDGGSSLGIFYEKDY